MGYELVGRACEVAKAAGYSIVLLVGDEPYFAKFGFSSRLTSAVVMPGPVDPNRLLARGSTLPLVGPVTA